MRFTLRLGLVALVMLLAGSGAGAQSRDQDQDKARANTLWQQALTLYGQGKKAEALTAFRESLQLWSDDVRKSYVARLQEALDIELKGAKPATASPAPVTPPKPAPPDTPAAPVTPPKPAPPDLPATPAAPPKSATPANTDAPADIMPLAVGALVSLDAAVMIQVREILAPYGTALHYAGKIGPADPSLLRVVFASLDGEFLELQMGVDAKGAVTVGDVSVESHGRDPARLALILQSYRVP